MALDTDDVLNPIINILKANTGTLATSLTTANHINLIKEGDARETPVQLTSYPCILIKLTREEEEFAQLGQRKNKHELVFEIMPFVYSTQNNTTAVKDIRKLTKNIKKVLKDNITLTTTANVLWSLPETVDYIIGDLDGVFIDGSIISFRTFHLST